MCTFLIHNASIWFPAVVPNYSFAALMQATEEKSTTMKLGSGGFGDVYMAKIRHAMVAVKFFREVS